MQRNNREQQSLSRYYHYLVSGQRRGLGAGLMRAGLWLASWPYRWVVSLRNGLYTRGWLAVHRTGVPVISIGNLTVGGTGKTPCVEYVCRFFRARDIRVAILSRGYGTTQGVNDEALLLEENLPDVPHLQHPDRVKLAGVAIEELESQVLVLDDGFQHRRMHRNLDIVLIDASNPWGHGYLLPRGLLRESPGGLRRAGVIVITRCDQVNLETRQAIHQQIHKLAPGLPVCESKHAPRDLVNCEGVTEDLTLLQQAPVAAFCGLGNPQAFRRTLTDLGAKVGDWRVYPDHHAYSRSDIEDLRRWAASRPGGTLIVTTQKDLVKIHLASLGDHPLWALRVQLHGLDTETMDELDQRLELLVPNEEWSAED